MPVTLGERALVVYRGYRSLYQDVPEAYFSIRHGDTLEAVIVLPRGRRCSSRLDLHMADRSASLESVLAGVRVTRLSVSVQLRGEAA